MTDLTPDEKAVLVAIHLRPNLFLGSQVRNTLETMGHWMGEDTDKAFDAVYDTADSLMRKGLIKDWGVNFRLTTAGRKLL